MKQKIILLILILILIFVALFNIPTYADVGDFETYSSDSHSSWSGSSGSESDYKSSWYDRDYDYDYDYNYRDRSGFDGSTIIALVITFIIIYICIDMKDKRFRNRQNAKMMTYDTRKSEDTILNELKAVDPLFDKEKFNSWVRTLFIKLQYSWSDRNWEQMRYYETKELFEQHSSQIQRYKINKQINKLENVSVNSISYYNFEQVGENDVLTVIVNSKMIDYIIDEITGQIVKGNKETYNINNYKLVFVRKTGIKTKAGENKFKVTNCPNCGAPIEITSTGKCSYCRSVIITNEHDWVLSNFERYMNL